MTRLSPLNAEGTTMVQVMHSEADTAYSDRVIQQTDGWIVSAETQRA